MDRKVKALISLLAASVLPVVSVWAETAGGRQNNSSYRVLYQLGYESSAVLLDIDKTILDIWTRYSAVDTTPLLGQDVVNNYVSGQLDSVIRKVFEKEYSASGGPVDKTPALTGSLLAAGYIRRVYTFATSPETFFTTMVPPVSEFAYDLASKILREVKGLAFSHFLDGLARYSESILEAIEKSGVEGDSSKRNAMALLGLKESALVARRELKTWAEKIREADGEEKQIAVAKNSIVTVAAVAISLITNFVARGVQYLIPDASNTLPIYKRSTTPQDVFYQTTGLFILPVLYPIFTAVAMFQAADETLPAEKLLEEAEKFLQEADNPLEIYFWEHSTRGGFLTARSLGGPNKSELMRITTARDVTFSLATSILVLVGYSTGTFYQESGLHHPTQLSLFGGCPGTLRIEDGRKTAGGGESVYFVKIEFEREIESAAKGLLSLFELAHFFHTLPSPKRPLDPEFLKGASFRMKLIGQTLPDTIADKAMEACGSKAGVGALCAIEMELSLSNGEVHKSSFVVPISSVFLGRPKAPIVIELGKMFLKKAEMVVENPEENAKKLKTNIRVRPISRSPNWNPKGEVFGLFFYDDTPKHLAIHEPRWAPAYAEMKDRVFVGTSDLAPQEEVEYYLTFRDVSAAIPRIPGHFYHSGYGYGSLRLRGGTRSVLLVSEKNESQVVIVAAFPPDAVVGSYRLYPVNSVPQESSRQQK